MVTRREFLETIGAAAAAVRLLAPTSEGKPDDSTVRLKADTTYDTYEPDAAPIAARNALRVTMSAPSRPVCG